MDLEFLSRIAGLLGAAAFIGSYFLLQIGLIKGNSIIYTLMNMAGALLVIVSMMVEFNLATLIIEVTWVVISGIGLARLAYLHYITKLSDEEAEIVREKFPGLSKADARVFFDSGRWIDAAPGTQIAVEGKPMDALVYLARGQAHVSLGGKAIAQCLPSSFIGEMTCFNHGPASATVMIDQPSRYFHISSDNLLRLVKRNADLKIGLEHALGQDTRAKLVAANVRMTERMASI